MARKHKNVEAVRQARAVGDRIEKTIELKFPVCRVWQALSDYEEFGKWFRVKLQGPFVPGQVSRGELTYPGYEHLRWEAEVRFLQPEKFFSFTWHPYAVDPKTDYSREPPTLVEFSLEPSSGGTLLSLCESGYDRVPSNRRGEAYRMNDEGWTAQLKSLEDYLVAQPQQELLGIVPCLWFDNQAEEAAQFYVTVFKDSEIVGVARFGEAAAKAAGRAAGSVMTVSFRLQGQRFLAINGGPQYKFNPAISLVVNCRTQRELDEIWQKLSADPESERCGWLKDRYGVSWQIVPSTLVQLIQDPDARKVDRVLSALMQMKKLDLEALKAAASSVGPA